MQEQLRQQESDTVAKEAAYDSVIQEKMDWLRQADKFKLEQAQSKAREETLIEETRNLRETIAGLTAVKEDLERANVELDSYKKALEAEKAKGEQTNEQKCKSLEDAIRNKDAKVKTIEQENERLLKEKKESEALIENLKKAQTGSDHYTRLIEKTRDRSVSDDDLLIDLMATSISLGVNLDQLSQGHNESLARAIIDVSCPFAPRPANAVTFAGCWRHVGNYLLPNREEFVWYGGTPVDLTKIKFAHSRLEEKLADAAKSTRLALKVK